VSWPLVRAVKAVVAAGWSLGIACSLFLGARQLWTRARVLPHTSFTASASTDALLGAAAPGLTSSAVRQRLAAVPAEQAVLFVGAREDPRYFQTLYTVSLLAVPRQLPGLSCATDGGGYLPVPLDRDRLVAALLFFGVRPADARVELLAPGVWWQRIPPTPATFPWPSFCPSSPGPPS
jgi:hypothetical protein